MSGHRKWSSYHDAMHSNGEPSKRPFVENRSAFVPTGDIPLRRVYQSNDASRAAALRQMQQNRAQPQRPMVWSPMHTSGVDSYNNMPLVESHHDAPHFWPMRPTVDNDVRAPWPTMTHMPMECDSHSDFAFPGSMYDQGDSSPYQYSDDAPIQCHFGSQCWQRHDQLPVASSRMAYYEQQRLLQPIPLKPMMMSPSILHRHSLKTQTHAHNDERDDVPTLRNRSNTQPRSTLLPALLTCPSDETFLSPYQVFLRQQVEVFEATDDDVTTHTRGRNRAILYSQVGIRCRHCAHLPVMYRSKGSTYFPTNLTALYQAAQNMSSNHLQSGACREMPPDVQERFQTLVPTKKSASTAGRVYWATKAQELGLVDTEDGVFVADYR